MPKQRSRETAHGFRSMWGTSRTPGVSLDVPLCVPCEDSASSPVVPTKGAATLERIAEVAGTASTACQGVRRPSGFATSGPLALRRQMDVPPLDFEDEEYGIQVAHECPRSAP